MPYKSQAQQRYFHYLESKGKLKKSVVDEFDQASKGKDLPKKLAFGGMVDEGEEKQSKDHILAPPASDSQPGPISSKFAEAVKKWKLRQRMLG